MSHQTLKI